MEELKYKHCHPNMDLIFFILLIAPKKKLELGHCNQNQTRSKMEPPIRTQTKLDSDYIDHLCHQVTFTFYYENIISRILLMHQV